VAYVAAIGLHGHFILRRLGAIVPNEQTSVRDRKIFVNLAVEVDTDI
jgi:hypothetical protein